MYAPLKFEEPTENTKFSTAYWINHETKRLELDLEGQLNWITTKMWQQWECNEISRHDEYNEYRRQILDALTDATWNTWEQLTEGKLG